MDKVSMELFKVHNSFKVKFCVVIRSDQQTQALKRRMNTEIINKFNYGGNNYTNIVPHPFLTIDITSWMDKNEEWSSNNSFNLTRRDLFNFIMKLSKLYSKFTELKDLFYYDRENEFGEEELFVNTQLAEENNETLVTGNKTILMQACVVEDSNTKIKYEGMFLSINSIDYFSYLTYSEMEFLIYELKRIDFNSLTLEIINTYILTENSNRTVIEFKTREIELPKKKPITEIKEEEVVDTKKRIGIPKPSTIPDI